jgi:5-methylcytosine-specific restriction endonuclease McrA
MSVTLFEKARTAARLLGEVTAELDGDVLDLEGAKSLVDVFTRCERFAVAGRGVAARRVATAINWKHAGHRNPAEWLASATGVGVGEAGRELETARRLEDLPATAEAFRAGELSEAQASEIAASAIVDRDAEAALLEAARGGASFRAVRDQCRETTMRAADDAARARRLHDTRAASTYLGTDGHVVLHAEMAPDVGAAVVSVLDQKTDELFRAARATGTTDLRAAYAADALAALVLGEGSRPSPDVRMHLDHAALARGYAEPGERCHLDGVGPVPVAVGRAMLQDATVTVLRHDTHGDITHVSSPTRTIPARVRRWVEEAYPVCGRHGCDSRFRLEIDHIVPFAAGGRTEKENLWRLCGHDHHLKTYRGWTVVQRPDGTRDLVPPDGHPPRDQRAPDVPDPPPHQETPDSPERVLLT